MTYKEKRICKLSFYKTNVKNINAYGNLITWFEFSLINNNLYLLYDAHVPAISASCLFNELEKVDVVNKIIKFLYHDSPRIILTYFEVVSHLCRLLTTAR